MSVCRAHWGRGRLSIRGRECAGVRWPGFANAASLLVAWVVLQVPRVAEACAVCGTGREDENAAAFLASTIFMSVLPLIAIGTIVYVLWRRIQKFEAEQEARRKTSTPTSPGRAVAPPPAISPVRSA